MPMEQLRLSPFFSRKCRLDCVDISGIAVHDRKAAGIEVMMPASIEKKKF